MQARSVAAGSLVLLALGLGGSGAAADPPEWSNGRHAAPTHSARPTPTPSPSVTTTLLPASEIDPAAVNEPPGNNGVVKIDGLPFDDAPDNQPHVGCTFQIDFFGYDEGDLTASYLFELWSPTGSGTLLAGTTRIGEDPAGGGTDLDASVTVDLEDALETSGASPHPNQGFHVRLTVHAEGSIGADVKHKTFWVTCAAQVLPTTVTSPPPTTAPPLATSVPSPAVQPTVLPSTIRPPGGLAFTGGDRESIGALAFALLLFGIAVLRASHRRERRHYNRG